VNKDVPDFALMVGMPARQIGWMSEYGEQLALSLDGEAVCEKTGARYVVRDQKCVKLMETESCDL